MPKGLKYKSKEKTNPIFLALRGLESYKFFVWITKTFNPSMTFKELAKKFDICEVTALNYYHQAEEKIRLPIQEHIEQGLKLLDDDWLESVSFNLREHNPIVTIEHGKGRGYYKQKFEVEDKRSPDEFKTNLITNTNRLLGKASMSEPIDLVKKPLLTEALANPEITEYKLIEPQGEEIKAKEDKDVNSKPFVEVKKEV